MPINVANPVTSLDPAVNFVIAEVDGTVAIGASSLDVKSGYASVIPDPASVGEYNVVAFDGRYANPAFDTKKQIYRVTAVSGTTLTITPAQESTTDQGLTDSDAQYWIILAPTKKTFDDIKQFSYYGMSKNPVINGNFDIWQRGTSFATPSNGDYTADRWQVAYDVDGGTLPSTHTHSKQTLTAGDIQGSYNYYRIAVDGAGSGFGDNAYYDVFQPIEFGTRYLCGDGKQFVIPFYAKSDISGKKIGAFCLQNYGTGGSPTSEETLTGDAFTLTSTWKRFEVVVDANTLASKTFGTANNDYLGIVFRVMWGATAGAAIGESTAEDFVGSGNIEIAQVGGNTGNRAMDFCPKSFDDELTQCQRYYEKSYAQGTAPGTAAKIGSTLLQSPKDSPAVGDTINGIVLFKQKKRTTPTMAYYGGGGTASRVSVDSTTSTGDERAIAAGSPVNDPSETTCLASFTLTGTASSNAKRMFQWTADAEL